MKNLFMLVNLAMISITLMAQSIEIDNVKRSRFNGVNPIFTGKDMKVEGYYTYYMVEKQDKGVRTFEFSITNNNLTDVKKIQVDIHKWANINNTIYNGKNFLISWDDVKSKKMVFNIISIDGKTIAKREVTVEKRRLAASTVYACNDGSGFYILTPESPKGNIRGYSLEKVNNKLEKIWEKVDIPQKGAKEVEDLINAEDRLVIWENYSPTGNPNKITPQLVAIDSKTGETIYINECYDGVHTGLCNKLRLDNDGSVIIGGAYVKGQKIKNVNNEGIYIKKLDPNGKEILYTKIDNKEKIQHVLKETSKGFSIGSKDKVFIEDFMLDSEGNIIVISEMFSKNLNVTPLAIQQTRDLIAGGKAVGTPQKNEQKFSFEIKDFILFKFNQHGDLAEIKPISKEDYNKITVYSPYNGMGGMALARFMSNIGWFDYGYTTTLENGKRIMVCKNNARPKQPEVFFYSLDENYAQKKVNLKKLSKVNLDKASIGYFNALRAEKNNVTIAYYQGKLKKITLQQESITE